MSRRGGPGKGDQVKYLRVTSRCLTPSPPSAPFLSVSLHTTVQSVSGPLPSHRKSPMGAFEGGLGVGVGGMAGYPNIHESK